MRGYCIDIATELIHCTNANGRCTLIRTMARASSTESWYITSSNTGTSDKTNPTTGNQIRPSKSTRKRKEPSQSTHSNNRSRSDVLPIDAFTFGDDDDNDKDASQTAAEGKDAAADSGSALSDDDSTERKFVPLDDADYGPVSPLDKWSFLGRRNDKPKLMKDNQYMTHMLRSIARYGIDDTILVCKNVRKCYKKFFQKSQDGQPEWTLRSIRRYLEEEHDFGAGTNMHQMMIKNARMIMSRAQQRMFYREGGNDEAPAEADKYYVDLWKSMRKVIEDEEKAMLRQAKGSSSKKPTS